MQEDPVPESSVLKFFADHLNIGPVGGIIGPSGQKEATEEEIKKLEEKYDPMKNFVPGSCEQIPAISFIVSLPKANMTGFNMYELKIKFMMKYIADFQKCAPVFRDFDGNKHRLCTECIVNTDMDQEQKIKLLAGFGIADLFVTSLDGVIVPRGLFTVNIAPNTLEQTGDPIELAQFIAEIAKNAKHSETLDFKGMMVSVRVPLEP